MFFLKQYRKLQLLVGLWIVTDLHKTGEDSDEDELFQINDHL